MQDSLSLIKQFESQLKAQLIAEFGQYLPDDKVSLLNATNYLENNYNETLSQSEINGRITRNMLDDLIDVECMKDIALEDGNTVSIKYGESLEDALIEYYAHNLSVKYHFDINEIQELKNDLETIKMLNQKLDGKLDSSVFSYDAVKLLQKAGFQELIHECDEDALKKYLERNKEVAAGLNQDKDKDKQNEIVKESAERENSVQLVWLDGKKYIKYVNQDGDVSLTEIIDNGKAEEFYKSKVANLKPGEKLDPEKFKHELDDYMRETTLTKTEDVKTESLNHKQINMLNFVVSNKLIREEAKKDVITHNNDMNIHVVESKNDIVVTKDKDYSVDAHIIKDGKAQAESERLQDKKDISSRVLTKEEYQELIQRFSRGEELTLDELESLKRTSESFIQNGQTLDDVMQESGPKLTQFGKNNPYGFTASNIISLIISVGAICTLILSIYLFIISIK